LNRHPDVLFASVRPFAPKGEALSNKEALPNKDDRTPSAPSGEPSNRSSDRSSNQNYDSRPIPDAVLAMFLAILAVALVLGYLFLNKMVDISRQEDCALAHRNNCAAPESSR
jgi:hypothetical protein